MGIPLAEDPRAAGVDPETPAQHATEGITVPSGVGVTFTYDLTTAGIPREAQRLISTSHDFGFDHLQADGDTTNLGKWWLDAGRRKLNEVYRELIRIYFILGPDAGAWTPADSSGFVLKYTFDASGSGTTITLSNYNVNDARSLGGHAISPGYDYVFSDPGGASDLTLITDVSIGDGSASITTAKPLYPEDWSDTVTICKATSHAQFPLIREDRTLLCERKATGWVAVGSFDTPYQFSANRIAYPLKWQFKDNGDDLFQGTLQVLTAENGAGANPADITDLVLGTTPQSGYQYSKFPKVDGPLAFLNDGAGFETTLDLSGVIIGGSVTHIKILYCEEIANPAAPDENTISPTQTSCQNDIIFPSNSALAGYSGANDINAVIDGTHFCTRYQDLNAAEVAAYRSYCNNSTCRFFGVHNPYIPTPTDVNLFWQGRGAYRLQLSVGQPDTIPGRDNHDGILTMLGFPVYDSTGLLIVSKNWSNHARFLYRTGGENAQGYDIFDTWQESVDAADPTDDIQGLFGTFGQNISKKDPAGGTA